MKTIVLAILLALATLAAAQTCNYTCNPRTCNPGRAVTGPCFGNFDEAALCGGVAPNCGSSSSGNATAAAYANMGAAVGVALHDWLEDYSRKAAEKKAFEAAVKRQLEQQRAEAERQHKIEEARRLDAMLSYLHQKLKLEGTPQLQLKLGESAQPNGYGICGLPGVATGGERAGCNTQQNSGGLGLKTGAVAPPPAAADSGSKLTLKLGEASEHGIPGLPGIALNDNSARADAQKLAANLTPEQAADIFSKLPPEQQQAILDRYLQQNGSTAQTSAPATAPDTTQPAPDGTPAAPAADASNPQSTPPSPTKPEAVGQQSSAMQQLQHAADSSQQGVRATTDEQASVTAGQPFDNGSSSGGTLQLKLEGASPAAPATPATRPLSPAATLPTATAPPATPRPVQPTAVSPSSIDSPQPRSSAAPSALPPSPAPRSPVPSAIARPLSVVASAEAIASGGLIVSDGEKICDYVQKNCRALVMQNVNPAASMRVMQGLAVPKWMELKGKSSLDPRIDGFIPVDQTLSKAAGDPKLLEEAQATVNDCLNPKSPNYRCGKKLFGGVWVLTDLGGRYVVADYDPLAFACSDRIESADTFAHRGVGKASENAAANGLNATGLQLPIQHLAANYSPKCIPPSFPATAFEADKSSGKCRVTSINSLDELRDFFSRNSIQWDPRWDRQPICGELKP